MPTDETFMFCWYSLSHVINFGLATKYNMLHLPIPNAARTVSQ